MARMQAIAVDGERGMTTVLVGGATGVLGRHVIDKLRARNVPVRALVRDPARAADLAAPGVELVPGELIDAARSAGVRRFAYTSAHSASPHHPIDFMRTKHAIEQAVKGSGLDAVILRPTAFMEHHVHTFNGKAVL